ncbi:MFS transporter [Micromonospora sagamiensis]|uniref:Putative MFS family arabinose efflux permease n=1 Tax=Micromonospora sagamiensis TaxID=47875 RepID=A0A562WIL1_9ACTN|nr:MFS transporter [Micromonospora sagamiensis]TWJ29737.1 putative MFS family arabinose efflux permease [Micromonospora sagamiensis]BCL17235.1 MFS transporter [Micromonospora sagamiensis]
MTIPAEPASGPVVRSRVLAAGPGEGRSNRSGDHGTDRRARNRSPLPALALGAFSIGTDSLIISGLLDRVAADLDVSPASAGQLISVFALLYAVGAPVLATVTSRADRRRLLLVALAILVLSNVLGALAPDYRVLMASRVLAAVGSALYLPCALAVAVAVAPQHRRGRAIALVAGGLSAATALGVPLGTLVGAVGDWRLTLALVAVLAALAAAVLALLMPQVEAPPVVTVRQRLAAAAHPGVLVALLSYMLVMTGEFTVFVFVAPLASQVTGVGTAGVSVFLLVWGIAAVLGSAVGGRAADAVGGTRAYTILVAVLCAGLCALALLALVTPADSRVTVGLFAVVLAVVSVSAWGVSPAQNHRIASLDLPEPTVAMSLNGSFSYLGLSLGGVAGGLAMEHGSVVALAVTGVGAEVLALVLLAGSVVLLRRVRPVSGGR